MQWQCSEIRKQHLHENPTFFLDTHTHSVPVFFLAINLLAEIRLNICSTQHKCLVSYELSHITYVWKNDEDTLRKSPSLTTLNAYLIQNATTTCPIKASWRGKFRIKNFPLVQRWYYCAYFNHTPFKWKWMMEFSVHILDRSWIFSTLFLVQPICVWVSCVFMNVRVSVVCAWAIVYENRLRSTASGVWTANTNILQVQNA